MTPDANRAASAPPPPPSQATGAAPDGLSSAEAEARLRRYGPNAVQEEARHPWRDFLAKFWAPVPWMLELTIVLEALQRKWLEGALIGVLLVLNAVVARAQEGRAQSALALLRSRLVVTARVRRDGSWTALPAEALVPGDAVHLRMGDLVPADVRVSDGHLAVDQSSLTGEALPVDVDAGGLVYAAAVIKRGEATGTVEATGGRTYFGRTAELVRTARSTSRLEGVVLGIVRYLVSLDLLVLVAVVAFGLFSGHGAAQIVPFALVVLLASVPVALQATFTLATAVGATDLAHSGVLATHLAAVEEAAGMDVLCSDKTGTLTTNQLAVSSLHPYAPADEEELLRLAVAACEQASLDPIDVAILAAWRARAHAGPADRRLSFSPFEPATKCTEATIERDGQHLHVVMGAPQVILQRSQAAAGPAGVAEDVEALAAGGLRALAVAAGPEDGLRVIGLVGLEDPLRPDSATAVRRLQELGVRAVMVTGDGPATARAIGAQVGIGTRVAPPETLRTAADGAIRDYDVFAGVLPEDKFALAQALQRAGHVVGMTGDGVNDAPALRQADVGVAVASATDVAKAAASLVLTRPGLSDLPEVVTSSRRIYQRMLTYSLNTSVRKLALPLFLGLALMIWGIYVSTPRLMVLLLFANDFVTMAIATDRTAASRQPDRWSLRPLMLEALSLAVPLLAVSLVLTWVLLARSDLDTAQLQTAVFVWLVLTGQATVYQVRERRAFWHTRPSRWLLVSTVGALAGAMVLAGAGWLMAPLSWNWLLVLLGLGVLYLAAVDRLKTVLLAGLGTL